MDDAFEYAVSIEERFFREGYRGGFERGTEDGRIEGQALGRKTGWDIWEELGYYEGQARFWVAVLADATDMKANRGLQSANVLLEVISRYPMVNAVADETDMAALLSSARSKYRIFCAHVGMRPRVQVATMSV